MENFHGLNVKF